MGGPVLRVRMGVHTGEAEERDGDFFGPAVNRAARIMGTANGGQVLVSDLTAGLVEQVADVKLVDLGSIELKGVIELVHVYGVAGEGHEWLDIALLTGQVTRGNLPRLQTESVGDLANLQRRVANLAQASVVTLTGSGGVGKTRAAIEIGWLVVDEFVDGVWLVELAPVADPDLAVTTIATALGAHLQPGSTMIESIVDWCLGRRMLLILDNCEHVLDTVIEVVEAIVAGCPTVTIIATSREPLGVAGETVARIASLDERYATELFVLRARSADAGFEPSDADGDAIAGICRRLDGIPLERHMAAGRTDTAVEIAAELRSTLPDLVDPTKRCWAAFAILQILDPDTIAADAEAALSAARAVGAPHLIAGVLRNGSDSQPSTTTDSEPPDAPLGFTDRVRHPLDHGRTRRQPDDQPNRSAHSDTHSHSRKHPHGVRVRPRCGATAHRDRHAATTVESGHEQRCARSARPTRNIAATTRPLHGPARRSTDARDD